MTTFDYGTDGLGTLKSQCSPLGTVPSGGTLKCGDSGATSSQTTWTYGDTAHPGDVQSVKDPSQQGTANSTTFTYNVDGQVASSIDAVGNKTTYGYDNVGRLTSQVSPRGYVSGATIANFTTTFTVDGYGAATAITAPSTSAVSRSFDADHNVTSEIGADGHTTTYVYDGADRLTQTKQASDTASPSVALTRWNADGTVQETQDPAGNITHYDYDHVARVIAQIDPSGTRNYSYDTFGRVVAKQDPGGNCGSTPKTGCATFGYDNASQLQTVSYSDGVTPNITATTYDLDGRLTGRTSSTGTTAQAWDSLGRLTSSSVNATTTGYGYDLAGRTTSITYPGFATALTRTYDAAGRWTGSNDGTASGGKTTSFGYDADSNLTSTTFPSAVNVDTYGVDNAGRPSAITFKQGTTTLGSLTYGRDGAGRVTGETVGTLTAASSTYTYNTLDQLGTVNGTAFGYDNAKNLTTQPGQVQQFNTANQVCWSATSGSGACTAAPAGATRYGYDSRGNRTSVTPPQGLASRSSFDQANRLTSVSQPAGGPTDGQYHELTPARVLDTRSPGPCQGTCGPISSGGTKDVQITGNGGIPATGVSAVVVTITTVNATTAGFVTAYPTGSGAPTASTLNTAVGQVVANSAIVKVGTGGKISILAQWSTDAIVDVQGWYSTPSAANGDQFQALNPARVLDTRTPGPCQGPCQPLGAGASMDVQITGNGGVPATGVTAVVVNLTSVNAASSGFLRVWATGSTEPAVSNLAYIGAAPISQMVIVPVSATGKITVRTLAQSNLIVDVAGYFNTADGTGSHFSAQNSVRIFDSRTTGNTITAGTAKTLTVVGAGNVPTGATAVAVNVTVLQGANAGFTVVYPADAATAPAVSTVNASAAQTVANAAIVKLSTDGKIKILTQNTADVLIDVVGWYSPATQTWTYTYDNDSLRTTKTSPLGVITTYTWDKTNSLIPLLLTETTGTNTTRYIYGPGGTPYEQINPDGSILYLHRDQLGSTRLITNSSGANVGERSYTPYGKPAVKTGSATTPFGYAGQYTDAETGFQYLRARYYDPNSAQFISRDPLTPLTGDPYGYTGRNPLNSTDPLGLAPWDGAVNFVKEHSAGISQGLEIIGEGALIVGAGACIVATAGGCAVVVGAAVAGAGVMAADAINGEGLQPTHWAIGAVAGAAGGAAGTVCGALCGGAVTGALTDSGIQLADGCSYNPWQTAAAAGTGALFGRLGEVPGQAVGASAGSRAFGDLFGILTGAFDPARLIPPIFANPAGSGS